MTSKFSMRATAAKKSLTACWVGEEPPEWHLNQLKLADAFQRSVRGSEEYYELGTELTANTVEAMWHIGTVGEAPQIAIRSNNLYNFPDNMPFQDHLRSGHSDQWFLMEE